jgi:hydroxymethylbilane synthase
VPLAAYAVWEGSDDLYLRAFVASTDGIQVCRAEKRLSLSTAQAADAMGLSVADDLIAQGAIALLPPR